MSEVRLAMANVSKAVAHRSRIGAELCPHSSPLLVLWYMDALEKEEATREVLRRSIDVERTARMRLVDLTTRPLRQA